MPSPTIGCVACEESRTEVSPGAEANDGAVDLARTSRCVPTPVPGIRVAPAPRGAPLAAAKLISKWPTWLRSHAIYRMVAYLIIKRPYGYSVIVSLGFGRSTQEIYANKDALLPFPTAQTNDHASMSASAVLAVSTKVPTTTRRSARAQVRRAPVVATPVVAKHQAGALARRTDELAKTFAVGFASVMLATTPLAAEAKTPYEGPFEVFNNPAVLGGTCVAVCWGIPQTVGMGVLADKEKKGREQLSQWGVDTSDVEQGSWGRIRQMLKREAEARGEEMPKI